MAEPRTRRTIAQDYQSARAAGDAAAMRRFQNEEACLVLLAVLERLAADPGSFIHEVALKGGILMAGELRSPRVSADIDATTGRQRRIEPDRIVEALRHAGREFNLRQDGEADRTPGGTIVHIRFDSLTDAGSAKLEVSIREDLVFAMRDALFDLTELGIAPFSVPALAEVELVAEKLRALVQRAQPRDGAGRRTGGQRSLRWRAAPDRSSPLKANPGPTWRAACTGSSAADRRPPPARGGGITPRSIASS